MNETEWKGCIAIFCLTLLEIVAMLKDIDGYLFALIVAIIAAIAGIEIRPYLEKKGIL